MRLQPIRRTLGAMRACDQETASALMHAASGPMPISAVAGPGRTDLCEPGGFGAEPIIGGVARVAASPRAAQPASAVLLNRYAQWAHSAGSTTATKQPETPNIGNDAWWRQERALTATLDAECGSPRSDARLVRWRAGVLPTTCSESAKNLRSPYHCDAHLAPAGVGTGAVADSLGLITPEERLRGLALPWSPEALRRLPERVELLAAGRTVCARAPSNHASFLKAFDTYARTPMPTALSSAPGRKSAVSLRA